MNQVISAMILNEVTKGASVKDAVNKVLGAGTFEKLASDVYDGLRGWS